MLRLRFPNRGVFLLLLALASVGGYFLYLHYRFRPETFFPLALANTQALVSYRYRIETRLQMDTEEKILSQITGEKASEETFHLQGKMLNQEIELYQFQDTTYLWDAVTQKWMVIPGNNLRQQELFLTEIDPLVMLAFEAPGAFQYLGREKVNQRRLHVFTSQPTITSNLLNLYWDTFAYKFWAAPGEPYFCRVAVSAQNKANPAHKLFLTFDLYDFNQKIKLSPPVAETG